MIIEAFRDKVREIWFEHKEPVLTLLFGAIVVIGCGVGLIAFIEYMASPSRSKENNLKCYSSGQVIFDQKVYALQVSSTGAYCFYRTTDAEEQTCVSADCIGD
jgi:hypothetical protein